MLLLLLIGTMLVLAAAGMEIAWAIGVACLVYLVAASIVDFGAPLSLLPQQMLSGVQSFTLIAIPMFVFAGYLMSAAGVTQRLIRFAAAVVGHIHGGLANVAVTTNFIMSGMSGSAVADAAATGAVLVPEMEKRGYPRNFACGVIASAATIAPIIPPSILFVLLGAIQNLSIGQLFLAGVVPGVLMFVSMFVLTYVISRKRNYPREQRVSRGELWQATLGALLPLAAPLIVLRAIMVGLATPTEAAAILVVYVAFLGLVVYRTLSLRIIIDCAAKAAAATAVIMLMAGVASMFARIALQEQFGQILTDAMLAISTDVNVLLLMFNIILLVLGMFMDALPIMLVLAPITFPIFISMGVDPIALGVVMVINLTLGLLTPPVGLILSTMSVIGKTDILSIFRAAWPYFLTLCVVLAVCTYAPQVILFLPRTLMPT
jgi:tripartite ATP-independent transporter DctM subunit